MQRGDARDMPAPYNLIGPTGNPTHVLARMPNRYFVVITERADVRTIEITRGSIEWDEQARRPTFSGTVVEAFGVSIVSEQ